MWFRLYPRHSLLLLLLSVASSAQSVREASVERVAVASHNPFQLQIQTRGAVTPQLQIVSSPERLVIDLPNAVPGPALRGIKVRGSEVEGVRVGLFSTSPHVTRIVVDLKQPQWYRVTPNTTGLLVILGSDSENPVDQQSTIGWVSTQTAKRAKTQPASFEVRRGPGRRSPSRQNGPSVEFSNGLMTIHSGGGTLSEILFQIQKTTGAEIAIPAGLERERVAADFGPGAPSEVLGELLNGTGLNFVVVGSEASPNQLRSVILSQKDSGVVESPQAYAPAYTPPPTADNVMPDPNQVPSVQPVQDENAPETAPPAAGGPPPDPPPS